MLNGLVIEEIIALNSKIGAGILSGAINYRNYKQTVKPGLDKIKEKHGVTPNLLIKRFLQQNFSGLDFDIAAYGH